jgi:hypothetical protein
MTLIEFLNARSFSSAYPSRIGRFCADPQVAALSLEQFTPEIIQHRMLGMARTGSIDTSTCNAHNNIIAALRAVFAEARRQGLVTSNPAADLRLPAPKRNTPLHDVLHAEWPRIVNGDPSPSPTCASVTASHPTVEPTGK